MKSGRLHCRCLTQNDRYIDEYAWTPESFNFNLLKAKQKGKSKYIEKPACFDIETSTIYNSNESKIEERDVYEAFLYHWQICLEGNVIFGRTWTELLAFLEQVKEAYELGKDRKLVVYVHNLAFEFQFMYRFFDFKEIFATDDHKVLRCVWNCFEFRCSYILSNMSLAKFISNTPGAKHLKARGDLDYLELRTPSTELTPFERGYCYNDVAGLYEALIHLLKDDSLDTIPMTSTGYVRRDCRKAMQKDPDNRKTFIKEKLSLPLYNLCKDCFRGGNTSSNRYLTNMVLKNVGSWDISSSYPYAMLSEKYPSGEFMYASIEDIKQLHFYNTKYCTIGRYIFKNVRVKPNVPIPYIPISKCNRYHEETIGYNGRVLYSQVIEIALTNIDFKIFIQQYDFDDFEVVDFFFSRKDYLPKELRDEVLKYFVNKSKLKGVKGSEYEYAKAKNKLNSIYGMTVTDILHPIFKFDKETGEFYKENAFDIEKYYKSRNSFLSYQWGVFVTAYARQNLQKAIDKVGLDCVYCDTDSVKYIGDHDKDFEEINAEITERCQKNLIIHSVKVKDKKYFMGLYDKEDGYDEFVTMGAKKYAYKVNGKLGITVSGLSKTDGAEELEALGGLKAFKEGQIFHKSGRTVAQYNNQPVHWLEVNGEKILTGSNLAIVPTTYTLGISDTMKSILLISQQEVDKSQIIDKIKEGRCSSFTQDY